MSKSAIELCAYEDKSLIARFNSKVHKSEGCWEWKGAISNNGYGTITWRRKSLRAHRLSWMIVNGDIPEGLFVCHTCDNRPCVNPAHLFVGTHQDNMIDMVRKGRQVINLCWLETRVYAVGEKAAASKLTEADVLYIRSTTDNNHILAAKFNVHITTIWHVKTRRTWKHI